MANMRATHNFLKEGGSELAPCSSTSDLDIAIRYAKKWQDDDGHDAGASGAHLPPLWTAGWIRDLI